MRRYSFTKLISVLLVLSMALAAFAGCGPEEPEESTPIVTTPIVTPEATTPEATPVVTTPEATTPGETTPVETPVATTPVETPPATEPDVDYNISYDLDGGFDGGNPTTYDKDSEFSLIVPIKPGYDFAGWTGTGLNAATVNVKISKGTVGDLAFKATWTANVSDDDNTQGDVILDTTHFGKDNGLTPNENVVISTPDKFGTRGEGIYTLKTVYTDIAIDGTMDAAYTYGLYFKSDICNSTNEYYENNEVYFEVYIIRGQDGRIYCYANVVDPTIIVNASIFNHTKWHVDGLDLYYEFGNYGQATGMYAFVADETGTFKREMPNDYKITMTETGYTVEFAFDNGRPTVQNDQISMQFYLNDTFSWDPETNDREKGLLKNHSVLNPVEKGYIGPSASLHDAVKASLASATGKVDTGITEPEKTGDMIADILSGAASVAIVYDGNATAQSILPAQDLIANLAVGGANISIMLEENLASYGMTFDYYIYLGKTKNAGSEALLNKLNYIQYGVSVAENALYMVGWQEGASANAYDLLLEVIDHVASGGKTSDMVGGTYTATLEDYVGADIPALDGFSAVTDVGEGAWQVYKLNSNKAEYDAYIAKLEEAGYTKYTENVMGGIVYCATYTKGDTVVNAQYGGESDKSIRFIIDPLANTALPAITAPEDANANVTVTSVTQLWDTNLCIIFQLSNGHFVILDSGNNGKQKVISDFLRKMAPDGKPVVEAWFFSHFHQDHVGGFIDYMGVSSLTRYVTVKSIVYNFPSDQLIQTAHKSTTDMNNMKLWYDKRIPTLKEKGTTIYQARTGQKYYFGNAEIEILWTFDDMMPYNIFADVTNHTCIGFTVTIAGQKFMLTGDSTEDEFRMVTKKYGDYIKSDFVQLAHHGSGNGGGDHDFYKTVNAPIVFHPRIQKLNEGGYAIGPNEKWAINNAQLVIRSGNYYTATLKLPFTIGDEIISDREPDNELG